MGKESAIDRDIGVFLRGIPKCRAFKFHGSAHRSGEPDWIGCIDGRMFLIETKRPGERSRVVQAVVQNKWRAAGATVITDASSIEDVRAALLIAGFILE